MTLSASQASLSNRPKHLLPNQVQWLKKCKSNSKTKHELEEISTKAFKQHRIKKDMEKIEVQIKDRELSIVP